MLRTEMSLLETWNDKYLILEATSEIINDAASVWFMPCMRLLVVDKFGSYLPNMQLVHCDITSFRDQGMGVTLEIALGSQISEGASIHGASIFFRTFISCF